MNIHEAIEKAHLEGHIGKRQKTALLRHAQTFNEQHCQHMLTLMQHKTFRAAHRAALAAALH